MANPIELLISLGVNDSTSRKNINKYIENLKTQNLDVTLTVSGHSSNNKVFTQMEKQIEELQSKIKQLDKQLANIGKGNSPSTSSGGATSRVVADLKQAQQEIKTFLKSQGFQNFDFKVNIDTKSGQNVLKGFTATVRDVNNEVKKLSFDSNFNQLNNSLKDTTLKSFDNSLKNVNKTLDDAKNKSQLTTKQFADFKKQLELIEKSKIEPNKSGAFDKLNNEIKQFIASSSQFKKVNKDIGDVLINIGNNGYISSQRLNEFSNKVKSINSNTKFTLDQKVVKLRNELSKLNAEFANVQHTQKMNKAMDESTRRVKDLESSFLKLTNTHKRASKSMDLSSYRRQLQELSNIPVFKNQKDIDNFNKKIKEAQSNIRRLSSELQEAGRSSQTFISMFSTAIEKMGIWLSASTLYFGVTRGINDLIKKVIELDTAITSMRRVMDEPSYVFNDMLEQSIQNVDALSGKLNDYLSLVNEFGRMGFNSSQALSTSSTAQTLLNISDLSAEESVNSLVAAMTAFNIEAEDSIQIADKLNEVKC